MRSVTASGYLPLDCARPRGRPKGAHLACLRFVWRAPQIPRPVAGPPALRADVRRHAPGMSLVATSARATT